MRNAFFVFTLTAMGFSHSHAALVGHYGFEEGSGMIAYDSALSDGTPTPDDSAGNSGGAYYVPGVVGSFALHINGLNGSPLFSNQDMFNGAPGLTFAAWVRLDALPVGGNFSSVVFLSNGSFRLDSRAVLDIDSAGRIEVGGRALDSETFRSRFTSSTVTTGAWYHLAGVIDYAADSVAIYINGVAQPLLVGATNFTGTSASNTNSLGASIGSTSNEMEFLNGAVDDLRIYNTALSAPEVAALVPEPSSGLLMFAGVPFLARRRRLE